jgi:YHS domain-containing protein
MADLVKDPVCGMEIDPKEAAATSDYEGVTYYFCAVGCKERFDAEPAKFLGAVEEAPSAEAPAQPSVAAEPPREAATASEPRKWWQFWRS